MSTSTNRLNKKHTANVAMIATRIRKNLLPGIFQTYFDIAYAIGMCPFRLRRNSISEKYTVRTWWPQTLLCTIINILVLFVYIGNIRSGYLDLSQSKKHPLNYFYYGTILSKVILAVLSLWQMWFGRRQIANLINFLADPNNTLPPVFKQIIAAMKAIILWHLIFACVGNRILIMYNLYKDTNPDYLLHEYEWARFYFYFDTQPIVYYRNGTTNYFPTLSKTSLTENGHSYIVITWIHIISKSCLYVRIDVFIEQKGFSFSIILFKPDIFILERYTLRTENYY